MAKTETAGRAGRDVAAPRPSGNGGSTTPPQLFETLSGIPVQPLYTPADVKPDLDSRLGQPGRFPFTRGLHPEMYRARLWTMRQFAGFGSAEHTNQRFH